MSTVRIAASAAFLAASLLAQPAKVDFSRDVLPILRQNCFGCHGPAQQINGMRLDRRSSVFKNGMRRVVPGSSVNSFVVLRLSPSEYGMQMPPTGPLRPEQVETIRAWVDQGADWPDALANEADLPPPNPKAVAMVDAMRRDDRQAFQKFLSEDPKLLNARGPDGATPFMYAVLYSPAATLKDLLKKGADANRHNDSNSTALMWAAGDLEKTRILLAAGADVNARSDEVRTPLMIASGRPGNAAVVTLLLERGAKTNPNFKPVTESSPLIEAATAGDPEIMRLLIAGGADVKAAGRPALAMAIYNHCAKCLDMLISGEPDKDSYSAALGEVAILGDVNAVRRLIEKGADVNAPDPGGRTPLMFAAGSDLIALDVVKLLVERGADIHAKVNHSNAGDSGWTALDIAKLRGRTPVVEFLEKAGAHSAVRMAPALHLKEGNTIPGAIEASLPLLQKADAGFTPKAGCVSCHNDSLAAMTLGMARKAGFRVDEATAAKQVQVNVLSIEKIRDRLLQGFFTPVEDLFGPGLIAYILMGLDAEHHKADLNTDAAAMYLKMRQRPDGHWEYFGADARPPICSESIEQTALSLRGLQLYPPASQKAAYQQAVDRAADWLTNAKSTVNHDRIARLLGLAWAGRKDAAQGAMKELLAEQRSDGGWADLPSMESNAYATGKSLVALQTAGMPVSDPAYQRGVKFLLKTQQQDGSWYVKTRALALQPFFDSGFPHGYDQYISSAGSNWATMALTLAAPVRSAAISPLH